MTSTPTSVDGAATVEGDLVQNQADIDFVEALLARGIDDRAVLLERLRRLEDERDSLLSVWTVAGS